jgi:hypothetical protein
MPRSLLARRKARCKLTVDGLKVHSFQTLLADLATVTKNKIQPTDKVTAAFDMLPWPTALQQRAFELLSVKLKVG